MAKKKKTIKKLARFLPAVMMAGAMTVPSSAGLQQQDMATLIARAEAAQSGGKVLDSQTGWKEQTVVNNPQQTWAQVTWGQVTWAELGGGPRQNY